MLCDTLRELDNRTPAEKRDISRAVFTYYRWLGWLQNEQSLHLRMVKAQRLAARFAGAPLALPADHLRAKAAPKWLKDEMRVTDDWLRSLQFEPRLWLRARPGQARALARKLNRAKATGVGDAVLYEGEKDLFETDEFKAGEFEIQDIASQIVGLVCDPKPGETWWDACAGEGGKTLHLADLMQGKGLVWATDRAGWRLDKLKRRAARARVFNYRAALWDGGGHPPVKSKCDGVLMDAPCSGIGTWGRNPHARWTLRAQDMRELAEVQKRLLAGVCAAVKPGGKLVYAVCTLAWKETTEVADAFTQAHPEFTPSPPRNPLLPKLPPLHPLWLWPQQTKGNGMFIAVWTRKED